MKLVIILSAICVVFSSSVASAQPAAAKKKTDAKALNLAVKNNGRTLLITNKSTETYRKLEIRLVVGMDFNSYVAPLKDIGPGKTISVNLSDVTTSAGVRFNPAKYKPLVMIEGRHENGTTGNWAAR